MCLIICSGSRNPLYRLRQVDVKAEHFERQLQRAEQERDQWEAKFEVCFECQHHIAYFICPVYILHGITVLISLSMIQESEAKYKKSKEELDLLVAGMDSL